MVITLGNIVFGGKGNGGGAPAAYVVPDGMSFARSSLTEFPSSAFDFSQKTNFDHCWEECSSLTEFPLINTANGTNFNYAWYNCNKLTSFPALDLSSCNSFGSAWGFCQSLKEFPLIDTSKGTDFAFAWAYCSSLTEFPALDLSSSSGYFYGTWSNCSSLITIPQLDLSSGINFSGAWDNCSALTTLGGFGAIKADIDLSSSTKLTVESLMNVITQAADLNELGLTGKTMNFGSTNLAKLTDEQKAVATNKGWTLA